LWKLLVCFYFVPTLHLVNVNVTVFIAIFRLKNSRSFLILPFSYLLIIHLFRFFCCSSLYRLSLCRQSYWKLWKKWTNNLSYSLDLKIYFVSASFSFRERRKRLTYDVQLDSVTHVERKKTSLLRNFVFSKVNKKDCECTVGKKIILLHLMSRLNSFSLFPRLQKWLLFCFNEQVKCHESEEKIFFRWWKNTFGFLSK
jgi:hypothetical protein